MSHKKRGAPAGSSKGGLGHGHGARTGASVAAQLAQVGPEMVAQVVDLVKTCVDCHKEVARCRTEQVRLSEAGRVQVEFIRARGDLLREFMEKSFAERKGNFDALFARLDAAMAQGSLEGTSAVLEAIVAIAKTSPFEALRDTAKAHGALQDKTVTWVL